MPNSVTMAGRDLGIRLMFTPSDVTPLTGLLVALTRSVPPNNVDISQIIEPSDPLYSRQPYGLGLENWAPTGFGSLYNTQPVVWPTVQQYSWGLISGWVLIDVLSLTVLNAGSILQPYEASTGITPQLPPGAMVIGFSDAD